MKFAESIKKCFEFGDEKISSAFVEYSYTDNDCVHKLIIFTKNYGKNKANDAKYTRTISDCVVYEWNGKKDDLRLNTISETY